MLQIAREVIVNKEEGEGEENHRAVYDELILDDLENVLDGYGKGAVEIILASHAFSYLGDLSSVFQKARAGLREGGVFALSIELLEDVEKVQHTLLGSEEGEVGEVIMSRKGSPDNDALEDIDRGYKLLPEAKYVHSSEYVANLALCSGFDIVDKQYGIMGWEGDKAIHGAVFLLEAI
jgi:predicted TPR repeat methyltransferase